MKWTTRSIILAGAAVAIMIYLLLTTLSKTTQEIFSIRAVPKEFSTQPPTTVPTTLATSRPLIPSKEVLLQLKEADLEELYYEHVENIEVVCVNKIRMGKADDGGWDVCDDPEYRPQPPCVVYSFGINFDFSFDDEVSSRYKCTVHAFDPSMKMDSLRRSDLVFFYNNGLDGYDHVTQDGWILKSLPTIMTELGHQRINILKMDIELYEFTSLPTIIASGILKNVDQLLFEIHVSLLDTAQDKYNNMVRGLEIFRGLYNNGFRIFYSHRNHYCTHKSSFTGRSLIGCHEVFMVNVDQKNNWHTKHNNGSAQAYDIPRRNASGNVRD